MKKLLLLLLVLGGLSTALSAQAWELNRWKNLGTQPQLNGMLMKDWNEMSPESQFWFVRGFVIASWGWYGHASRNTQAELKQMLANMWPLNEKQIAQIITQASIFTQWRDTEIAMGLIDLFLQLKMSGQIPKNY